MVKGYGSTNNSDEQTSTTPLRGNLNGSSYITPPRTGSSNIARNTSNSAETTRTQESDPLLGEKLLVDDVKFNLSKSLQLQPRRTGFESAPDLGRGINPKSKRETSIVDSLIGNNVMIYDDLDTLAYSQELDDSTFRHFMDDVKRQRRGFFNRFFGSDPALPLVCLGLVVGIAICAVPAFLYVQYHHHQDVHSNVSGDATIDKMSTTHSAVWSGVPYQKISRAAYGDPVSNFIDESLFHPSLLYHGEGIDITRAKSSADTAHINVGDNDERRRLASSSMKPFLRFPFPTGAFWTNLVLLPQTSDGKPKPTTKSQSSYPIVAYPYSFQWSALGRLQVSYSASRRKIQSNSIQDAFAPDVSIGSVDNIHSRHVVKYDSLSVTLRYYGEADEASRKQNSTKLDQLKHWDTYIVQGSPYVTARYYGLRPELTALSDFTDIACVPTMKTEEERLTTEPKTTNSTQSNRRRMSIFSEPSLSATTGSSSKKFGVCGISEKSTRQKKIITGVQFVVTSQEGLTWLVFASEPITFEFDQAARRNIKTSEPFQGVIRLALVPPPPSNVLSTGSNVAASTKPLDEEELASSSGVKRLIYHAGTFPIGGTVNWSFRSGSPAPLASSVASGRRRLRHLASSTKESTIGSITFTFNTMHMSSLESTSTSAQMELLMLSLPHHASSISSADKILFNPKEFDLFYRCIKGRMVPVVGSSWTYEEKLTSIGFDDETSIDGIQNSGLSLSSMDQSIRDLILQTVDSDLKINMPVLESGAYGFGKGIARLAQLALIAESIEGANADGKHATLKNVTTAKHQSNDSSSNTSQRAYALLEKYLTMWLVGDGGDRHLFYDVDLGGIVSKDGLTDVFSDFGNVRYNDHHFHYGYVLYAAAILGRAKPKFISQYGSYVDSLFYDVAHNSSAVIHPGSKGEIFFPLARHKSWFDGHSFASGLFPFADGKSQESSSEATNCYFGAYLWSKVRWAGSPEGDKIVDYARLLLATEITGAKTYWHMTPRSIDPFSASSGSSLLPVPYNTLFQQNYMVGNLGMSDVTSTTWFGTEVVYVHLINFMPVTAITSELFDKAYVKGERQVLMNIGSVEKAWTGYLISNEAIIEPNKAWMEAQSLVSNQLDSGSSKSQVLYWILSRPGFSSNTTTSVPGNDYQSSSSPSEKAEGIIDKASAGSASCSAHDNCVKSQLVGICCPTSNGIMLSCCN